ncbi:MAG TPA: hypothetical protein PLU21_00985 [Candidatus Saccharibacteria bacterium]|nr:hypothetical protein [Candidatus Saccharibacteria bacterium]
MIEIYIYHRPYTLKNRQTHEKKSSNTNDDSIHNSLNRSKRTIYDIIFCNEFDYWCTFTFDKKKHNRYDINRCKTVMSMWLHNQHKHSPKLKYVIVPELHKDGAIHFHALISNFNGTLKKAPLKTNDGRQVYSATGYQSGFTRIEPIYENGEKLANYMTKYITKDMPLFNNRKRFWTSQNLTRPKKHVNGILKFNLTRVIENHKDYKMTPNYEIQYHKKVALLTHQKSDILIDVPPTDMNRNRLRSTIAAHTPAH